MFEYKQTEIEKYLRDLGVMKERAIPFAIRNTVNGMAFKARTIWQGNIDRKFIQRNKFTRNSIRVERATGLDVRTMEATTGSIAPYMATQEDGGTKTSQSGKHVNIPTSESSGEGEGKPRKRLPFPANRMKRIQLRSRVKSTSRRQRNAIAIKQAVKAGNKFVYLELSRKNGIFKITGGKRKPRVRMMHDLSRRTVVIPQTKTLEPTVDETVRHGPTIAVQALRQQVQRQRLFR